MHRKHQEDGPVFSGPAPAGSDGELTQIREHGQGIAALSGDLANRLKLRGRNTPLRL
jgi:hypothetical protein